MTNSLKTRVEFSMTTTVDYFIIFFCLRSRPVSPNVVRPLVSDNVENLSDWVTGSFADD